MINGGIDQLEATLNLIDTAVSLYPAENVIRVFSDFAQGALDIGPTVDAFVRGDKPKAYANFVVALAGIDIDSMPEAQKQGIKSGLLALTGAVSHNLKGK